MAGFIGLGLHNHIEILQSFLFGVQQGLNDSTLHLNAFPNRDHGVNKSFPRSLEPFFT